MNCAQCGQPIVKAYFTALINGVPMTFHINCKPQFFYKEIRDEKW